MEQTQLDHLAEAIRDVEVELAYLERHLENLASGDWPYGRVEVERNATLAELEESRKQYEEYKSVWGQVTGEEWTSKRPGA